MSLALCFISLYLILVPLILVDFKLTQTSKKAWSVKIKSKFTFLLSSQNRKKSGQSENRKQNIKCDKFLKFMRLNNIT